MKTTKVVVIAALLMFGLTVWAADYPKMEVTADYSLVHFVPAKLANTHNLNGGGGQFTYNFTKFVGLKADFQGYGSQSQTFRLPSGTINTNGNLFTYLFGPQIKLHGKYAPFVETLFGAAHSNVYSNAFKTNGAAFGNVAPDNNGFAMLIGGGLDIRIAKTVALRPAEVGYLLTRFGNNINGTNANQNNFRYSGGIVFQFGSSE